MVAPRVYHGEYTLQETVILTQLNLNMQARDLERMEFSGGAIQPFLCTLRCSLAATLVAKSRLAPQSHPIKHPVTLLQEMYTNMIKMFYSLFLKLCYKIGEKMD